MDNCDSDASNEYESDSKASNASEDKSNASATELEYASDEESDKESNDESETTDYNDKSRKEMAPDPGRQISISLISFTSCKLSVVLTIQYPLSLMPSGLTMIVSSPYTLVN